MKLEITQKHLVKFSHVEFKKKICGTVYGIHRVVHLWSYIKYALLWINIPENWNDQQMFVEVSHV
jgi:hypothetical protein